VSNPEQNASVAELAQEGGLRARGAAARAKNGFDRLAPRRDRRTAIGYRRTEPAKKMAEVGRLSLRRAPRQRIKNPKFQSESRRG
jgi:hypothetical protein